jgi:hypothetical protein
MNRRQYFNSFNFHNDNSAHEDPLDIRILTECLYTPAAGAVHAQTERPATPIRDTNIPYMLTQAVPAQFSVNFYRGTDYFVRQLIYGSYHCVTSQTLLCATSVFSVSLW